MSCRAAPIERADRFGRTTQCSDPRVKPVTIDTARLVVVGSLDDGAFEPLSTTRGTRPSLDVAELGFR